MKLKTDKMLLCPFGSLFVSANFASPTKMADMRKMGSFSGFRARSGVKVDANWDTSMLKATLFANRDGDFIVRYGDKMKELSLKKDKPVIVEFKL